MKKINKTKIAFAASRELACSLIRWIKENEKIYNIEIVGGVCVNFTNWWGDNVSQIYKKYEIKEYSSIEELVAVTKPDMLFSFNYWKIISENILSNIPKGVINIHHSYKLRFRGRHSTSWAIIHAREDDYWWHGTSIHYVNSNLDDGEIILSEKIPISKRDTAESLFKKVECKAIKIFKKNFSYIVHESEKKIIKPDKINYFYSADSKNQIELKSSCSKEHISDIIRAWTYKGRPMPNVLYNGNRVSLEKLKNKLGL